MNDGLEPEWLDSLPASDPKADRSRRDLRLLNVLMGNAGHLAAAARRALGGRARSEAGDLGAGDGTPMRRLARRLGPGRGEIGGWSMVGGLTARPPVTGSSECPGGSGRWKPTFWSGWTSPSSGGRV